MIVKMQSVRVYGSSSRLGTEARQNPCGKPIVLKDCPLKAESVEILLGEEPTNLFEAHRRKTALANVILDATFGRHIVLSDEYTLDDAIGDQMQNTVTVPVPMTSDWYVTILIEREVELEAEQFVNGEFPLIRLPETIKRSAFRDYTKLHLDYIASILSTVLGTEFFESVILDEVLFVGPGGIVTRIPEQGDFKMSGRLSVAKPIESLDCIGLYDLLSDDRMRVCAKDHYLESAIHWYAAMLIETDPWKAFQYAFLALEILTHKMSKRLYNSVRDCFEFKQQDGEPLSELPITELFGNEERLSLLTKFCIMALGLRPREVKNDVSKFKAAKKARDKFSHGEIRDETELPLHSLRELCLNYFEVTFRSASLQA